MIKNLFYSLILLLTTTALNAQTKHWLFLSGGGGYAGMTHNLDTYPLADGDKLKTSAFNGYGALFGGGYELHTGKFLLNLGAEGNYQNATSRVDDFLLTVPMQDTQGEAVDAVFAMDKNRDNFQAVNLNIPLMLGVQFSQRFYMLGGAKYGLNFWGSSRVKSEITTWGDYIRLIDPLQEMPNHHYDTQGSNFSSSLRFAGNLAASLEVGYYLRPEGLGRRANKITTRLSLFADYGLLNVRQQKIDDSRVPPEIAEQQPTTLFVNTIDGSFYPRYKAALLAERAQGKKFTPFFAGLKFTVLFDVTPRKKTVRPSQPRLVAMLYDAQTEEPLAATLTFNNSSNRTVGKITANAKTGIAVRSFSAGEYAYEVTMEGYKTQTGTFTASLQMDTLFVPIWRNEQPEQPVEQEKTVEDKLEKGDKIILKNLFFDFDKSTIKPESEPVLRQLEKLLKDNPTMKIHIEGHTDSFGSDEYNERLSDNRAKAVRDEMIRRGIAVSRMTWKGKGEKEPIATNETAVGRAENRRVEFTVIEK